ncbi:unnamed protein product [Adineta ricciae]|uniref:LEM domain-containing protein n=1 Tax=Adineta ricciae TaxID=249248 RepID=A0A813UUA1_ADIRI|nr:unnamed protein product [Adineta ricciae]CAF1617999.1 unnamed protein product [Adineta ricciae]
MVLTDQQLRQELISHGETVPPITQRNREQLRARLEVLRSHTRTRTSGTGAASSPSRSQASSSPLRTRSAASPARTRNSVDSPSTRRTPASPSGRRATASPSRTLAANSPSRARGNVATTTTTSVTKTRTKQTPHLIELSDSDNDASPANALRGRSDIKSTNVQTRSIGSRHQRESPKPSSPTRSPPASANMTNDVEQSIARHRREIKQLLDSARDRSTVGNTPVSSLRSGQPRDSSGRQSSPSPSSKTGTRRHSSRSDHETVTDDKPKKTSTSSPQRGTKSKSSSCKNCLNVLKSLLKFALIGSILLGGLAFLYQKRADLFPPPEVITCSIKNASTCDQMKPVIGAVRKQLQIRTGEVDCGFRDKSQILVTKQEIQTNLDEKGLKFQLGNEERWKALIEYIKGKPVSDIILWTVDNKETNTTALVAKMSTKEALRSLTCRARQDVDKTLRNLALLILGPVGLLTLAWFVRKQSKAFETNEAAFKNYLKKAKDLLEEQYKKHVSDPNHQPWVAINHIRDKLIPEEDQERLKHVWERVKSEITKQDSRLRGELQEIDGKASDVWRWIKSAASSPKKSKSLSKHAADESDAPTTSEVGLTESLKLRNCFRSDDDTADDDEIDHVVESVQNRCAKVKSIEHIGIHSNFVYVKFSSKEAAAQGYHLLNNWRFQNQTVNVKYIRLNRYYEHFPEAKDASSDK